MDTIFPLGCNVLGNCLIESFNLEDSVLSAEILSIYPPKLSNMNTAFSLPSNMYVKLDDADNTFGCNSSNLPI